MFVMQHAIFESLLFGDELQSMSSIKDQTICSRGQVILTKILMNGKGTEFDIFHLHIAQDVVFCVWPPPHMGSP
jgi:hypothetical protein